MQLLDLPPELFGGDAHKDGFTLAGCEEVARGDGVAKYLDRQSLAAFAGSCRTARKFAESMKNDLPRTLALHLVKLSPQKRALTAKSLLRHLGMIDKWSDCARAYAMSEDSTHYSTHYVTTAAVTAGMTYLEAVLNWEDPSTYVHFIDDHLPKYALVICRECPTLDDLSSALKVDTRKHPFWEWYAERYNKDRWHQAPGPEHARLLQCSAIRIFPEVPEPESWLRGREPCAVEFTEPPRGSLWCGKIDVENEEADGGWGLIMGPHSAPWRANSSTWTPERFWDVVTQVQHWD
jgi:hypothetical protein